LNNLSTYILTTTEEITVVCVLTLMKSSGEKVFSGNDVENNWNVLKELSLGHRNVLSLVLTVKLNNHAKLPDGPTVSQMQLRKNPDCFRFISRQNQASATTTMPHKEI